MVAGGFISKLFMTEQKELIPNHTSLVPNLIATFIFFIPCMLFFFLKLYLILLIYDFIILFLLVSSVSNTKWKNEINKNLN